MKWLRLRKTTPEMAAALLLAAGWLLLTWAGSWATGAAWMWPLMLGAGLLITGGAHLWALVQKERANARNAREGARRPQ
jgi:hypothetical protein